MSRSLPAKPSLENLKKQAKDLLKAHKKGDADACKTLRLLHRFAKTSDEDTLAADVALHEAQYALAMDYGFENWAELKAFVESLEIMRSGGLPLSESASLSKWAISNPEDVRTDGDTWVFTGKDVRAEIGGMSWDNYVLSADVWIKRTSPDARYCVQLTGRGTSIYCQLVPGCVLIAYYDETPKGNPKGFTHLERQAVHVPDRTWFNFRMKAEAGIITALLDGREIVSAAIPCGTRGMPGLLVNQQNSAEVRVRNVRVQFLNPTPEQLREYGTDAGVNWGRYVTEHG